MCISRICFRRNLYIFRSPIFAKPKYPSLFNDSTFGDETMPPCYHFFIFLFSQSNVFSQPFTILKDINYGGLGLCLGSPQPLNLTESGGSIFFSSNNSITAGLWKTDGSNTGTSRVKEISGIGPLKNLDGLLLFAVGNPNLG